MGGSGRGMSTGGKAFSSQRSKYDRDDGEGGGW